MMQCAALFWGICFVPVTTEANLFGFKDFITALALLVIIFTLSDIRYRFRVSITPMPLFRMSFVLIGVIGFGTLITDLWISEKWLVPENLLSAAIWQGILATLFLGLVITWMWYSFIKPPIFGANNYKQFSRELYRIVLKGSEAELPIIAHELASSAESLVKFASNLHEVKDDEKEGLKPCAEAYANDMLLLIANRKLCRHIVASAPSTAIRFLNAVVENNAYHVPIGLFAQNMSTEAIQNKDSSLYHEDGGYYSGLLGYIRPLSQALYGNYELVESLQNHSPLDINYKLRWKWDATQFETYCRATQLTLKSYLEGNIWGQHSFVLTHALNNIGETTSRAIYEIKETGDDYLDDPSDRLREGVNFIRDCADAIDKLSPIPKTIALRIHNRDRNSFQDKDFYDRIAVAMFGTIHSAAYIKGPPSKAWDVHFVSVWSRFFEIHSDGPGWRIILFKLRRMLYDEIRKLESMPNYKSARVLGICLNTMGLTIHKRSSYTDSHAALKTAVLSWTQRNYLHLKETNQKIADACIIGSLSFDAEQSMLVKTYIAGLGPEPDQEFLPLMPLDANN